ncbi:MAG: tetratricopeptide repeat protein [Candidatus Melainabacteria bacterium]
MFCLACLPVLAQPALKAELSTDKLVMTDDIDVAKAQVEAYPDDPEAHFLLAMAYSRTPFIEEAFKSMKRAKGLMKTSPQGYANLDAKLAEYEDMLRYSPDDTMVLYRLAFGYFSKGYGIEKNYIKNNPDAPAIWYDKAEETMRRVIALDPADAWARNYLGFLLININEDANLDEAMMLWEEAVAIEPLNPGAHLMLGEAYMKKGDLKKALQHSSAAIEGRLLAPLKPL